MNRLLPTLCLATGCFYGDPINQRPSIAISNQPEDTVFRGEHVTLRAEASDPENQVVGFTWRAYACTDEATCDAVPFDTGKLVDFPFTVPMQRVDAPVDVTLLRVVLAGVDDYGATAKPSQELLIALGNGQPTLEVGKSVRPSYVVATPVTLFAKYGDPDDDPTTLSIDWHVFTPTNAADPTLTPTTADPVDDKHVQKAMIFESSTTGSYDVLVTVTDTLGASIEGHIPVEVVPDAPPCIALYEPTAPLDLAQPPLPMNAPQIFSVPIVTDDLDAYPSGRGPSDPVLGTATFAWSLKGPGASTFTALGVTANNVQLDPGAYTVGDQLQLRVDIADRNGVTLSCPDSDLTCATHAGSTCIQRLTWRVEVR